MNGAPPGQKGPGAGRATRPAGARRAGRGRETSPPITTTAKARTITSTPIPGTTDTVGAVSAPPSAASVVPTVKVTRKIARTSTPIAALTSRSWMTASRSLPWRVR